MSITYSTLGITMSGWTEQAAKKARKAELEHSLIVQWQNTTGYGTAWFTFADFLWAVTLPEQFDRRGEEAQELIALYNEGL